MRAFVAVALFVLMPPQHYRHEPVQPYTVRELSINNMALACGLKQGTLVLGCAWPLQNKIFLVDVLTPAERDRVLIHEKAHLNGWEHQRP